MFSRIKKHISRYLTNYSGWQTDRKIIVIESDDWGSIRMPSKQVYEKCLRAGYPVDQNVYERFDSLASEDDLELLFDVLRSFKDSKGNSVTFTANILTANPDFEEIKNNGFEKYRYELLPKTFKNYPNHSNCLSLWKKGIEAEVFYPQSHGREHLNVSLFMNALRNGDEAAHFGFEHEMPGCIPQKGLKNGNRFVESLRYSSQSDKKEKLSILEDGLDLFNQLMGYQSKSLMPPNYLWSSDYDKTMFENGIQFYQGRKKMVEPLFDGNVQIHKHSLGEENSYGQRFLVRNAFFEPTILYNSKADAVDRCLKDIAVAFRMNKPAVISSHRLNYVGFIDVRNRDKNLKMLKELLDSIIRKWPEAEFWNSEQLGDNIISSGGSNVEKNFKKQKSGIERQS